MTKFEWHGETYEVVERDRMSWSELDQLEQLVGLTTAEMREDRHAGRSRISAATVWLSIQRKSPDLVSWADFFAEESSAVTVLADTPAEQAAADAPPLSEADPADPTESTAAPEPGSGTSDDST